MSSGREESFLTVAEVADWLKLNQQTVRNWIDQGSLPAVRVGRRVRIKQSDLDRILAEGYQGAAPEQARVSGPSADDFWGGEPVGVAEPNPAVAHPIATVSRSGEVASEAGASSEPTAAAAAVGPTSTARAEQGRPARPATDADADADG